MDTIFAVIHRKPRSTIFFFCDQWIPSPWEDDICWDASAWLYLSTALRPSWRATCEPLLRDPVGEAKNDMTTCEARGDLTIWNGGFDGT